MLHDYGFDNVWRMIFVFVFLLLFLVYGWILSRREKFWWAWLTAALRLMWIAPLLFLMWPKKIGIGIDQPLRSRNLYILLDDSRSMQLSGALEKAQSKIEILKRSCEELACNVEIKKLSEFRNGVRTSDEEAPLDYTYMEESLAFWLAAKFENDPVLVFSDGGDHLSRNLDVKLDVITPKIREGASKLYLYLGSEKESNYAITNSRSLGLSFSNQKPSVEVSLQRSDDLIDTQRNLQIQIYAIRPDNSEQILVTQSFRFQKGERSVDVGLDLPVMTKGQYMLYARLLTPPEDRVVWDNHHAFMIKILPNTVGLLHLLGAPSWDGRFLRRYIKSEIKYDTVSFYILRDPTDLIPEKDRELSLIPFPVERLFTKELSRFKVLIMQNFALSYFLDQEEYRNNLVRFVKDGGGLLFIGGPRALLRHDVQNSSLKEILPFSEDQIRFTDSNEKASTRKDSAGGPFAGFGLGRMPYLNMHSSSAFSFMGSSWNSSLNFRLKVDDLDDSEQKRISFWAELQSLAPELEGVFPNSKNAWSGLQDVSFASTLPKVKEDFANEIDGTQMVQDPLNLIHAEIFDKKNSTVQEKRPFVMASFPGKGRALWILSDEIWKLANQTPELASRGLYTRFMQMVFQWLLKEDLRPALQWQTASLQLDSRSDLMGLRLELSGPAVLEFESNPKLWSWNICGKNFDSSQFKVDVDKAMESLVLEADVKTSIWPSSIKRKACSVAYEAQSPAFGNLKSEMLVGVQQSMSDEEFAGSEWNARSLAKKYGMEWINSRGISSGNLEEQLVTWIKGFMVGDKEFIKSPTERSLSYWDYFHWLNGYWLSWILFFMILEVVVQRRKWIFGARL